MLTFVSETKKTLKRFSGATDVTSGDLELAGYEDIFKQMVEKFNFEYVISSLRVSHSASDNGWSACIYSRDTKEFYHSKEYRVHPIVDRVGGGDSAVQSADLLTVRILKTHLNLVLLHQRLSTQFPETSTWFHVLTLKILLAATEAAVFRDN